MGQHDIGDYFKNRVKGYNKDIDTDELWANLNIDGKKKKRGAWWIWLMGTGFILFVPSLLYFMNENYSKDLQQNTEDVAQVNATIKSTPKNNATKINTTIENKKDLGLTQIPAQDNGSTQTLNPKPNTISSTNKKGKQTTEKTKKTSPLALTSGNTHNAVIGINNSNEIHQNPNVSNLSQAHKGQSTNIASSPSNKIPEHHSQSDSSNKKSLLTLISLEPLTFLKTLFLHHNEAAIPTIEFNQVALASETTEKAEVNKKKGNLSMDIYTGAFAINRIILNNEVVSPIFANKENDETPLEMIAIGGQVQYKWANNLYAKVGLEFQTINEKYRHKQTTLDTVNKNSQPTTYFVSVERDTSIFATGAGQSVKELNEYWTFYNNHKLLTIPLTIGYEVENNKWSYNIDGTILTSFYNQYSGTSIEIDGSRSTDPSYMSTKIKMGYRLSIGIQRQLTNNIDVYLKPSYQVYSSSFANGFSQKYSFAGGLVGLRYGWE